MSAEKKRMAPGASASPGRASLREHPESAASRASPVMSRLTASPDDALHQLVDLLTHLLQAVHLGQATVGADLLGQLAQLVVREAGEEDDGDVLRAVLVLQGAADVRALGLGH